MHSSALRQVLFHLPTSPPPDEGSDPNVQMNPMAEVGNEEEEGEGGSQTLMSWDSTILASVFLTLRMVRREAGL